MNAKKIIPVFGIGLIVLFVLAYLYAFVTAFSPAIYLNFFLMLMFGSFIGFVSLLETYYGLIRNKKHWMVLSLINSIVLWYISWIIYILAIANETSFMSIQGFDHFMSFLIRPDIVFLTINDLSHQGLWSVSFLSPDSFTFWMIWIIEFMVLLITPIIFLRKQSTFPYSELNEAWYKEYVLSRDFGSILGFENALERLKTKPNDIIEEIGFGKANNYCQISVFYLPNEKTQYLSVFHIVIDREDKKSKEEIYHLIQIDKQSAKDLISNWKGKPNKFIFF